MNDGKVCSGDGQNGFPTLWNPKGGGGTTRTVAKGGARVLDEDSGSMEL